MLERAAFVCCDSIEDAKLESGDLIEPVEAGVLDWLEVHELQEVVAGELPGRQADDDIVVFKSNGLAAWDVAIGAVARRASPRARRRPRALARASCCAAATVLVAEGVDHLGPVEQARDLLRRGPVPDVRVVEDLVERRGRARARGSRRPRAGPPPTSARRGTRTGCGGTRESLPIGAMLYGARVTPVRKPSAARFAEREVHGVDDRGEAERIVIWIERLPGAHRGRSAGR